MFIAAFISQWHLITCQYHKLCHSYVSYLLCISIHSFTFVVEVAHASLLRHTAECDCVATHHLHCLALLVPTSFFQRGVQLRWTGRTFPAPDIIITVKRRFMRWSWRTLNESFYKMNATHVNSNSEWTLTVNFSHSNKETDQTTNRFRFIVGELVGEAEWRCASPGASPGCWKSADVLCDRRSDVESGISVNPLILSNLAVSSTCLTQNKLVTCHRYPGYMRPQAFSETHNISHLNYNSKVSLLMERSGECKKACR